MAALTVVYVVLAFSEGSAPGPQDYVVWALAVVFVIEFSARCYDAPDRAEYLRTHWLDLVTAVPVPGVPGLRLLRLLRLLRFLRVGILVRRTLIGRGWGETGLIWPTMVLFWIASGLALWLVEHDAPGSSIASFPDAMRTAFLTAATLGFGKRDLPVTQDGQIIAAVIVFFALGLWGFASTSITHFLLNTKEGKEIEHLRKELHELREQLKSPPPAHIEST